MYRRVLAFILMLILLMGMSNFAYANDITVYEDINADPPVHTDCDIKVMSFNILTNNSGSAHFDTPANRYPKVLKIIEEYAPDVVGIQEANASQVVDSSGRTWPVALAADLYSLGYDYTSVTTESGTALTTGQGEMIFYKRDRFEFDPAEQDHGFLSLNTQATYNGVTAKHNQNRGVIWAELIDTAHNDQSVYFFNTHLSINVTKDLSGNTISDSATISYISNDIRTQQIKKIANLLKEKCADKPFFAMGDYNTSLSSAYSDSSYTVPKAEGYQLLAAIPQILPSAANAATSALQTVTSNIYSHIDHIYLNSDYQNVQSFHAITDNVDGRRPSDHLPVLAYANYRVRTTDTPDGYDEWKGTLEQTVTGDTFTQPLSSSVENITFKSNVSLPRYQNNIDIEAYQGETLFDTVKATIYRTDAPRPSLLSNVGETYFSNGRYHAALSQDVSAANLTVADGKLYKDSAALYSQSTALTDISDGTTVYYIKHNGTGEIFPLLIHKETASAAADTLYVDDDLTGAEQIGAYNVNGDVILVQIGENGFADLESATAVANQKDGYTIQIADGTYQGNTTGFTQSITILGANAESEANKRVKDGVWTLNSDRTDESIIIGPLRFTPAKKNLLQVTVKGLFFTGACPRGSIYFNDSRTHNDVTELDFSNNIFNGTGNATNSSAIYINNATQKVGVISGNAFISYGTHVPVYGGNGMYYRGVFARNPKALLIENNRFSGLNVPLWLSGETVSGNVTDHGYNTYTVQNNRFEYCGNTDNAVRNVGSETHGFVRYLDNDFIRCGRVNPVLIISLNETTLATDFSKISVEIIGNRFFDCQQSIRIQRSSRFVGDVTKIKLHINKNRFVYPNDHHDQNKVLLYQMDLYISNDSSHAPITVTDAMDWSFSHNYFISEFYKEGDSYSSSNYNTTVPDVNDPQYYTRNLNVGGNATLANLKACYLPYYADYGMTRLVCEHNWAEEYTVDSPATCGRNGSKSIHCTYCDGVKTNSFTVIPATGEHTGGTATCQTPATCAVCSKSYGDTADHTPGKWITVKKATHLKAGRKEKRCTVCNTLLDSKSIPKLESTSVLTVFTDLKKNDWFVKNGAIDFVYNSGYFTGLDSTRFGPDEPMTRGMFVTVLGRLHGIASTKKDTRFTDVKKNDYFSGYVKWAADKGIVSGTSATTFSPNDNVTREQICKMVIEYCNFADVELQSKNSPITFLDENRISKWAKNYVEDCQICGIVGGEKVTGGYRFNPQGNATRAEVATILMNFCKNYR